MSSDPPVLWQISLTQPQRPFLDDLTTSPTILLQILLLIGIVLVALRAGRILRLASRIPTVDHLLLGVWSLGGLVLRLLGGVRVPGWINSHGYELMRDVLIGVPAPGPDPHGNGFHALYGLVTSVLPANELTVVSFQCLLSVGCIPLVYLVARFWFGNRRLAIWSAAVTAVLPGLCWYAATEVQQVPGCFFMLVVLCLIGASIRLRDPCLTVAAAVLGSVTSQFYPVLMILPLVAFLYTLSAPGGPSLLRSGWTWAAAGIFLVLWLGPAIWMMVLVGTRSGGVIGPDILRVFDKAYLLFVPTFELNSSLLANTFLNQHFTPPVFSALAVIGLLSGFFSSSKRLFAISIVLTCALVLTLPGLVPGGMNPARLQLLAMPFYAMLAGAGLAWLSGRIRPSSPWSRTLVRQVPGAAIVLASLAIWPGVLGTLFTPQLERRAFERAAGSLEEDCLVIWPPHPQGGNNPIPYYLFEQKGIFLRWANLLESRVPAELIEESDCAVYYRPATCYLLPEDRTDDARTNKTPTQPLQPGCARVERRLLLSPVYTERIPALPDYMHRYRTDQLETGFFRIDGVLPEEAKLPDPP